MGYIEEEDDIETDSSDNDGDDVEASSGVDLGFFDRSLLHARRAFSMSGSDKVGNDSRGLSHTQHRSRRLVRIPVGRDKSRPSGHFASWSGPASSGDEVERRKLFQRGRRSSSRKPRGRRTSGGSSGSGSGSDSFTVDEQKKSISSDGSTEGAHRRKLSVSDGKMKKTSGSMAPAAAAVTLSAKAAAILNAMSPPVTRPELPTRGDIEAEVEEANDAVPFDPVDTSAFELSPATHASPVPDRSRKRPSARSLSLNKPVELNHPVVMHTTSSFNTKVKYCITSSQFVAGGVVRREPRRFFERKQIVVCGCMSSCIQHVPTLEQTLCQSTKTILGKRPIQCDLLVYEPGLLLQRSLSVKRCNIAWSKVVCNASQVLRRSTPSPRVPLLSFPRVARSMECCLLSLLVVIIALAIIYRPRFWPTTGMHIPPGRTEPHSFATCKCARGLDDPLPPRGPCRSQSMITLVACKTIW